MLRSGIVSGVFRIWQGGAKSWRALEHEPTWGSGGGAPAGFRDRAPGQGVRGRSPPEAERYLLLMSRQILHGFLHVCCFVLKLPCTKKTRKIIEAELTEYFDSIYDLTFDLTKLT
jgi:hypothetical protein